MVEQLCARGQHRDVEVLLRAYIVPMAEHLIAQRGRSWHLRLMGRFIVSGAYVDHPFPTELHDQFSRLEHLLMAADPLITQRRVYLVALHAVSVMASLETRLALEPALADDVTDGIEDLVVTTHAVATAPTPPRERPVPGLRTPQANGSAAAP